MKSIAIPLVVITMLGAGCVPAPQVAIPSPSQTATAETRLCTDVPTENEAGRTVYPIAMKYKKLPHLGQIFTAIDCGDIERAKRISGFDQNGNYTAGMLIKWKEGGASGQIREALRKLGFTEPDKQTMRADHSFSINDLRTLRDLLLDPDAVQALDREDCISCG